MGPLRELDASHVGAFTSLSPLIGVASDVVLLGETVLVGVLVLAGVRLPSRQEAIP